MKISHKSMMVLSVSLLVSNLQSNPWWWTNSTESSSFMTRDERLVALCNKDKGWAQVYQALKREGHELEVLHSQDLEDTLHNRYNIFVNEGYGRGLPQELRDDFFKKAHLAVTNVLFKKNEAAFKRYAKLNGRQANTNEGYIAVWWKDGVKTLESLIDVELRNALHAFNSQNPPAHPGVPGGHSWVSKSGYVIVQKDGTEIPVEDKDMPPDHVRRNASRIQIGPDGKPEIVL